MNDDIQPNASQTIGVILMTNAAQPFRDVAEKSAVQVKENYRRFKSEVQQCGIDGTAE